MVFVSHDRYFIDKLATRVFEVEDGRVHVFPGNYEDYQWRKAGGGSAPRAAAEAEPLRPPKPPRGPLQVRRRPASPNQRQKPSTGV